MLLILIIYGYSEFEEASLILEELPAVTEPFALKVGPSFFNFTGMWLAVAKKQMA
jgi:hypothetical protein